MVLRLLLLATPCHLDRVKALMGTPSSAFAVFYYSFLLLINALFRQA
jgi:hypothetical protein